MQVEEGEIFETVLRLGRQWSITFGIINFFEKNDPTTSNIWMKLSSIIASCYLI